MNHPPSNRPDRLGIFLRGSAGQCPRCRSRDIFRSHFHLQERCPQCGLPLEMEDGWSYGSVPLAYGLVGLLWVLPVCLLSLFAWISPGLAIILGMIGVVVLPLLTYRLSKKLWTGLYYAILCDELETAPIDRSNGRAEDSER